MVLILGLILQNKAEEDGSNGPLDNSNSASLLRSQMYLFQKKEILSRSNLLAFPKRSWT